MKTKYSIKKRERESIAIFPYFRRSKLVTHLLLCLFALSDALATKSKYHNIIKNLTNYFAACMPLCEYIKSTICQKKNQQHTEIRTHIRAGIRFGCKIICRYEENTIEFWCTAPCLPQIDYIEWHTRSFY